MEVTIRAVDPPDVPGLEILRRQAIEAAFRSEYDREDYVDLVAATDQGLTEWVDATHCSVVLAETEVTPVCYGVLDHDRAEILALFTSPDYQDEGFATLVLERIESVLDDATVEVVAPGPSMGFFERRGFERIGDAEWNGLPAVRMEKQL